jgi:hypothetical protein
MVYYNLMIKEFEREFFGIILISMHQGEALSNRGQ